MNAILFAWVVTLFAGPGHASSELDPTRQLLIKRGLVEMESYERGRKLCDIFSHPAMTGRVPGGPQVYYFIDSKFRASVNEWYRAIGRGVKISALGDEKEKFVQLTSWYTDQLVSSLGFQEAVADCYNFMHPRGVTLNQYSKFIRYTLYGSDIAGNASGNALMILGAGFIAKIAKLQKLLAVVKGWIAKGAGRLTPQLLRESYWAPKILLAAGAGGAVIYWKSRGSQKIFVSHESAKLQNADSQAFDENEKEEWSARLARYQEINRALVSWQQQEEQSDRGRALEKILETVDAQLPHRNLVHEKLKSLRRRDNWPANILQIRKLLEETDKTFTLRQSELEAEWLSLNDRSIKLNPVQKERRLRIYVIFVLQQMNQNAGDVDMDKYLELNTLHRLLNQKYFGQLSPSDREQLEFLSGKVSSESLDTNPSNQTNFRRDANRP